MSHCKYCKEPQCSYSVGWHWEAKVASVLRRKSHLGMRMYRVGILGECLSFSTLTLLLVGRQEEHLACKKSCVLVCHCDWSFACLIAPVVTVAVILSSCQIQNGDILVLANPGQPGKMAAKMERFWGSAWCIKRRSCYSRV